MDYKNILITIIVAVTLSVFFVMVFFAPENGRDGRDGVGAVVGPEVYDDFAFRAGLVEGGLYVSTSTFASTATLLASDLIQNSGLTKWIAMQPGQALSLTLPATSTLTNYIPNAGDCKTVKLENTATSTFAITIVAGTGMDLQEPDGQNVVIGQNNFADMEFCRDSSGGMVVKIDETIPAD